MPSPSLDVKPEQLLSLPCAVVSRGGCSPLGGHHQAVALMEAGSPPSVLPLGCPKERREHLCPSHPLKDKWHGVEVYSGMAEL